MESGGTHLPVVDSVGLVPAPVVESGGEANRVPARPLGAGRRRPTLHRAVVPTSQRRHAHLVHAQRAGAARGYAAWRLSAAALACGG